MTAAAAAEQQTYTPYCMLPSAALGSSLSEERTLICSLTACGKTPTAKIVVQMRLCSHCNAFVGDFEG
jgi:hypothetical protein